MPRPAATPETRSVRLLKVGEQVRHVLSELLTRQHVHDEVLTAHSVSVTEVRMSPDLRIATVYVKPLLGQDEEAVLKRMCGEFDLSNMFTASLSHRMLRHVTGVAALCVNVMYLDVSNNGMLFND